MSNKKAIEKLEKIIALEAGYSSRSFIFIPPLSKDDVLLIVTQALAELKKPEPPKRTVKRTVFHHGQREFGGDASTAREITITI